MERQDDEKIKTALMKMKRMIRVKQKERTRKKGKKKRNNMGLSPKDPIEKIGEMGVAFLKNNHMLKPVFLSALSVCWLVLLYGYGTLFWQGYFYKRSLNIIELFTVPLPMDTAYVMFSGFVVFFMIIISGVFVYRFYQYSHGILIEKKHNPGYLAQGIGFFLMANAILIMFYFGLDIDITSVFQNYQFLYILQIWVILGMMFFMFVIMVSHANHTFVAFYSLITTIFLLVIFLFIFGDLPEYIPIFIWIISYFALLAAVRTLGATDNWRKGWVPILCSLIISLPVILIIFLIINGLLKWMFASPGTKWIDLITILGASIVYFIDNCTEKRIPELITKMNIKVNKVLKDGEQTGETFYSSLKYIKRQKLISLLGGIFFVLVSFGLIPTVGELVIFANPQPTYQCITIEDETLRGNYLGQRDGLHYIVHQDRSLIRTTAENLSIEYMDHPDPAVCDEE